MLFLFLGLVKVGAGNGIGGGAAEQGQARSNDLQGTLWGPLWCRIGPWLIPLCVSS